MTNIPVIIYLSLNRYDLLEKSIASIDHPVDDVLVIDNGGTYEGGMTNPNVGRFHLLNMPNPIGVSAGWNLGIKCFFKAPYWVVCSDDVEWEPGTLKRLSVNMRPWYLALSNYTWNAFALGSNVVKNIGIFDENIWPAYHEDTDYEIRIKAAGMEDKIRHNVLGLIPAGHGMSMMSGNFYTSATKASESNEAYLRDKIDKGMTEQPFRLQRWIDNEWVASDDQPDGYIKWDDEGVTQTWT